MIKYLMHVLANSATHLSRDTQKIQWVTNNKLTSLSWQRKFTHLVNQRFKKVRDLDFEQAFGRRLGLFDVHALVIVGVRLFVELSHYKIMI